MINLYSIYLNPTGLIIGLVLIVLWEMVWKGIALWRAARNKQKAWFVVLLILNTVGILPILYLLFFKRSPFQRIQRSK